MDNKKLLSTLEDIDKEHALDDLYEILQEFKSLYKSIDTLTTVMLHILNGRSDTVSSGISDLILSIMTEYDRTYNIEEISNILLLKGHSIDKKSIYNSVFYLSSIKKIKYNRQTREYTLKKENDNG